MTKAVLRKLCESALRGEWYPIVDNAPNVVQLVKSIAAGALEHIGTDEIEELCKRVEALEIAVNGAKR